MIKFVGGNIDFYDELKSSLQDGMCHVYKNCMLPNCCNKKVCRIGFEKDYGAYRILIDMGISCSNTKGGIQLIQFKHLLENGELIFLDFNDLKIFLRSLSFLFD